MLLLIYLLVLHQTCIANLSKTAAPPRLSVHRMSVLLFQVCVLRDCTCIPYSFSIFVVLSEVKAHGLLLDQKSWESVISSQVQLGDAQAAVSTLHSMKSAGYTPTRYIVG